MRVFWPEWMSMAAPILGLIVILAWRVGETARAVSAKTIVLPPLFMATGMSMFALDSFRVPWLWAASAVSIGAALLGYPLVRTTKLVRRGDLVMMHRSKALFLVIFGLAAVRFAARGYLDTVISGRQTAALAYLLAFGMIVRWRTRMYFDYQAIRAAVPAAPATTLYDGD